MTIDYDPGYCGEPWVTLCRSYPSADVYPPADFRVEWGPLFHRGRLDGSARILVIGQDPTELETIARRILVGEDGQRTQGFLAKLGITRSYVMVNTYLYGIYRPGAAKAHISAPAIADYRHAWLNAIVGANELEAIITLGSVANKAYHQWLPHAPAGTSAISYRHLTHPTAPNSGAAGSYAGLVGEMLANWNDALQALHPRIHHPDVQTPLHLYGAAFQRGDNVEIPAGDLPPGLPAWMRGSEDWALRNSADWAERLGPSLEAERATIVITVPSSERPWSGGDLAYAV